MDRIRRAKGLTGRILLAAAVIAGSLLTTDLKSPQDKVPAPASLSSRYLRPSVAPKKDDTQKQTTLSNEEGTPSKPDRDWLLSELHASVQSDDLCRVYRIVKQGLKEVPTRELMQLIGSTPDATPSPEPAGLAAFAIASLDPSFNQGVLPALEARRGVQAVDFYRALALTGILTWDEETFPESDLAGGIALLADLAQRSPGNGVYPLFAALAKAAAERPRNEIRDDLLAAFRSQEIDSHTRGISQRVMSWASFSSTRFLIGNEVVSRIAIAHWSRLHSFLREFIEKEDEGFAQGALRFSGLLMKPGFEHPGRQEFLFWSALEYQVGIGICRAAWKKIHGNLRWPKDCAGSYRDLFEVPRINPFAPAEMALEQSMDAEKCERSEFDEAVQKERQLLLELRQ